MENVNEKNESENNTTMPSQMRQRTLENCSVLSKWLQTKKEWLIF